MFRWRKGVEDLTPDDAIPIGKNVLLLTNIRETAVYTCAASSKLGLKEINTTVKVQCKEIMKGIVDDVDILLFTI